jgi:hypothetical protein
MLALKKRKDAERWGKREFPFRIFSAISLCFGGPFFAFSARSAGTYPQDLTRRTN